MRAKVSNIILGALLILLGVGFLGNIFKLWDFHLFFDGWWTLFIIIPCVYSLISDGFHLGNTIGLGVGVLLLLAAQDIIDFSMIIKIVIPAVLILVGIHIIFFGAKNKVLNAKTVEAGAVNLNACFSGNDSIYPHEPFRGASCSAVFGGIKLDLRNAIIPDDQVISCSAVFGGIDILLPQGIRVEVDSVPIFGGVENKYFLHGDENSPKLYIKATCIFGGVEVK